MKQVAAAFFMSILSANADPLENCRQCVVVTTTSWSATKGTMSILQRTADDSPWQIRRANIPVATGKRGLALTKHEGDNKAPAGIFRLVSAFGYARAAQTKMPYQQSTPDLLCVDDSRSRFYNRIIDQRKIDKRDWNSAEKMRRDDVRYKWGVFIDYNHNATPSSGSCIFLHVWISPNESTIGCTAMSEKDMVDLIGWLDPGANPMLVQFPHEIYAKNCARWNLPPLR